MRVVWSANFECFASVAMTVFVAVSEFSPSIMYVLQESVSVKDYHLTALICKAIGNIGWITYLYATDR